MICDPRWDLSWRMFHVPLRRKCILLLSDGMSFKHQLSVSGLMCLLKLVFPCYFFLNNLSIGISSVQSLSHVQLFVTPWTAAYLASQSIADSGCLFKLMSIGSMMPSNYLILSRPLLPPSIFPSIRVFSSESILRIRWPKYWSFSFSTVLPMNIQDWFPLGLTGWISLQSKGLSRVFSNTTVQKRQFFNAQLSL